MSERKPWQVIHVSGSAWWDVMDGSDLVARFTNSKDAHQVVADHSANLKGGDANCQASTPTCNQTPVDAGSVGEPVAWQWRASKAHKAICGAGWVLNDKEARARELAVRFSGEVRPLYAARQDDGWQPIETAPRDGTPIILAAAHEGWVAEGFFETHDGRWYEANSHWTDAHDGTCEPTHWRPLPPA